MAATVLVTGGTGYIGGEVIDQLLAKGYSVHTTVRNKAKSDPKLRQRWAEAGDRLKIFQADLMSDEGWAEANAGCDAVAHVASPFPLGVPKDKDELVVPAREGTLRTLDPDLVAPMIEGMRRVAETLAAAHGTDHVTSAMARAVQFGRWRADDIRSILAAGHGVPTPTRPGQALVLTLPAVPTRSLQDYRITAPGGTAGATMGGEEQ